MYSGCINGCTLHVCLVQDVGSKVNLSNHKMSAARKDALIAMLHQIKVSSVVMVTLPTLLH